MRLTMRFGMRARVILIALLSMAAAACSSGAPRAGSEFRDCATCPVMLTIPAGAFRMGFDGGEEGRPEGPVRDMSVARAFALGRYEVTQREFAAFVADTRRAMRGGCQIWTDSWQNPVDADWTNPGYGRLPFDDEPVACISWQDAQAYAEWLAQRTGQPYRLPSEAEWEYSARAGTVGEYYWLDAVSEVGSQVGSVSGDDDVACDYANVYDLAGKKASAFDWQPFDCDDGFGRAAPIGSFRANAFGLHDMLGNLWEWTADCYVAPYPDAPLDGSAVSAGACDRRVARGGSWITRPSRQRVTFRGRDPPETLYQFFGFRVARDL